MTKPRSPALPSSVVTTSSQPASTKRCASTSNSRRSRAVEEPHPRSCAQERLRAEQHRSDADAAGDDRDVSRACGAIEAVAERSDDVEPIAAPQLGELARALAGYKEEKARELAFCFVDGKRRRSRLCRSVESP